MKQYIKDSEVKNANQIIVITGGKQIINPFEKNILADGWKVYEEPKPTAEELLQRARQDKIYEIDAYDHSDAVNEFMLQGHPAWLDKDTRVGLTNSLNYEQADGRKESTMWFGGVPLTLPIDKAFQMLAALELYALECYNVTASHKAAVAKLESIEAVEAYDYKQGYPEKLNF